MKISPEIRILEALARVTMLDILLVLGLYLLRDRGWKSWFDAVVGCVLVFYFNGRIMHNAFSRAYPDRPLPNFWKDH